MMHRRKAISSAPLGKARALRQQAQALVEFTLMLPLILLLLVGLLEFGMLFKDHMGIHYASREGARVAAAASRDHIADCYVLDAIATTMRTMEIDKLVMVRIYRGNPLPGHEGECLPFNGGTLCPAERYFPAQDTPSQCVPYGIGIGWHHDTPSIDEEHWTPDDNPGRSNQNDSPDTVVVEIRYNHPFLFNYIPSASGLIEIFDRTFTQIEPERFRPVATPTP
jgi:hypothetical protein